MAVSYSAWTREKYPDHPPYRWHESTEEVPFQQLTKPLSEAKVALMSSGGVYVKSQTAFDAVKDDYTYRVINQDVNPNELVIAHDNYDHTSAEKDINSVLPYQRLQDLNDQGFIGEFSDRAFSFMGRLFSKKKLFKDMVPAMIEDLQRDNVDAVLLVPVWPLCHQTVGLISREIEKAGIPTVTLSSAMDVTKKVQPPRTAFSNYPLGNTAGKPNDIENQTYILKQALSMLEDSQAGEIKELDVTWTEDPSWDKDFPKI